MNANEIAARAASFARGASDYDRLRPEFPARLFDDLYTRAGGRMAGRILEIGAGTGRATLPLARRGAGITVIEPSADMLRVLGGHLQAEALADHVTLRQATFEDVDPAAGYDVVVAAKSFHWTDLPLGGPGSARCSDRAASRSCSGTGGSSMALVTTPTPSAPPTRPTVTASPRT